MTTGRLKVGEVLYCEDGSAIVVEPGTTPLAGLLSLLEADYGGEPFAEDNPAILAALPRVRVEEWRSCTKSWCESENVDREGYVSYWAPNGDGASRITVARYDGHAYELGDQAAEAELAAATALADDLPGASGVQQ